MTNREAAGHFGGVRSIRRASFLFVSSTIALVLAASLLSFVSACGRLGDADDEPDARDPAALEASPPDVTSDASARDGGGGDANAGDTSSVVTFPTPDAAPTFPDATPMEAACAQIPLLSDAAVDSGVFTTDGIACATSADCMIYVCYGTCNSCTIPVFAVNDASTGVCAPHDCPPPPPVGGSCREQGFVTQDCKVVPDPSNVGVACVDNQCQAIALTH